VDNLLLKCLDALDIDLRSIRVFELLLLLLLRLLLCLFLLFLLFLLLLQLSLFTVCRRHFLFMVPVISLLSYPF
jgi:hypothetical protein